MKVAIAYVIAVLCAPVIGMLPGFIVALLFSWIPDRVGVPLRTFLGGCAAAICAVGFGFLMFTWIVGVGSFGVLPYLATILPISISVVKDYRQYQGMKQIASDAPDRVRVVVTPDVLGAGTHVLGGIIGILVGGYLFVNW